MGAHVVFFGPSTAGKTSLMLGLARQGCEQGFSIDRTWTTRVRRPGEGDEENIFANSVEFEQKRPEFLFTFQTFPSYEYGIDKPRSLSERDIRMRILMPVFAVKFRQLVKAPTLLCAISPFHKDPENVFRAREPDGCPEDLHARMERFHQDMVDADEVADLHFQNSQGLQSSIARLSQLITNVLAEVT